MDIEMGCKPYHGSSGPARLIRIQSLWTTPNSSMNTYIGHRGSTGGLGREEKVDDIFRLSGDFPHLIEHKFANVRWNVYLRHSMHHVMATWLIYSTTMSCQCSQCWVMTMVHHWLGTHGQPGGPDSVVGACLHVPRYLTPWASISTNIWCPGILTKAKQAKGCTTTGSTGISIRCGFGLLAIHPRVMDLSQIQPEALTWSKLLSFSYLLAALSLPKGDTEAKVRRSKKRTSLQGKRMSKSHHISI